MGRTLAAARQDELDRFEKDDRLPPSKENQHQLLVIGMDGGRVQSREKDEKTGSRWKEDKVLTITSCLAGDGKDKPPQKLLTTYVATMQDAHEFARLEAEKRGIRKAVEVVLIGDGGNWIDPICEAHFGCHARVLDYYHAAEHLHEAARASLPADEQAAGRLADGLVKLLWNGKRDKLLARLGELSKAAGAPLENDPPGHPRKVLAANAGYFEKHRQHIDYPAYRARGWPVGSGITESGVKLFGKRVKGTEQFWNTRGAPAILALRSRWLSEDEDSKHYWLGWPAQAPSGVAA